MQRQSQLQEKQEVEDEEVTFVTDTIGDKSLQPPLDDYMPFPRLDSDLEDDTNSSDSENTSYDLDHDYSWHGRYKGN